MKPGVWLRKVPWMIVFCAAVLMVLGLFGITRGDQLHSEGDFALRQMVWIALSLPAMLAATLVSYRSLRGMSYLLFATSLLLLVIVYFMPAKNGAHRWIPLGVLNVQPSELAKLTFVMAVAHYLMDRRNYRRFGGLLMPFVITLLPVVLILREPDLGTSMIFLPVLFSLLFAAGARPRHLLSVALLGVAVLPLLWMGMSAEQKSRIVTVFVQQDGGEAPKGDGYHLHQSKRVLAVGGLAGREPSDVTPAHRPLYHLPAGRTDFILCLVGERFGLIGTLATLTVCLILFAQGLSIAAKTRDPFGRLLAVGIVALLATQTTINAGMTVGLMPITGMTLPLMSYGGSSLLATCLSLGLLMNVGMRSGYEVTPEPFRFSE